MKRCVVCGAAPFENAEKLKTLLRTDDVVAVADGGDRLAAALGVTPFLTVADFDSSPVREQNGECIRLPIEKDVTDTHAAMEELFSRGYREFLLLGCLGGRLDHTMAAILAARLLTEKGCRVTLCDEKNTATVLLPGTYPLTGNGFSVFAMTETVEGLTLSGVKYPLCGFTLHNADPLCVSNEVSEENAHLSFKNGVLLLIFSKD